MNILRLTPIVRRYSSKRFPEQSNIAVKPTLGQFKYPLYHCFLIASSTYIFLNTIWYKLEHDELEQQMIEQSRQLEQSIQDLVHEKSLEMQSSKKPWWKW